MSGTISVCSWDDFQHYRDRDPTWIKLHRSILTSEPWLMGNDATRLLQVAIMLLAARYKNEIPYKPDLIRKASHIELTDDQIESSVAYLVENKFLIVKGILAPQSILEQPASMSLAKCSSEKRREEERREDQNKDMSIAEIDLVALVFQHWQREWSKPRSALDPKRRALINKALKSYTPEDLCRSISGYRNSDFHRGQNDRNTVYDDIGLFLRDSGKIDQGLKFSEAPVAIQQKTLTTADLLARGHPDELE